MQLKIYKELLKKWLKIIYQIFLSQFQEGLIKLKNHNKKNYHKQIFSNKMIMNLQRIIKNKNFMRK